MPEHWYFHFWKNFGISWNCKASFFKVALGNMQLRGHICIFLIILAPKMTLTNWCTHPVPRIPKFALVCKPRICPCYPFDWICYFIEIRKHTRGFHWKTCRASTLPQAGICTLFVSVKLCLWFICQITMWFLALYKKWPWWVIDLPLSFDIEIPSANAVLTAFPPLLRDLGI